MYFFISTFGKNKNIVVINSKKTRIISSTFAFLPDQIPKEILPTKNFVTYYFTISMFYLIKINE